MAEILYEDKPRRVAFIICDRCNTKSHSWRECYICKRTICKSNDIRKNSCYQQTWVGNFEDSVCLDCYAVAYEHKNLISQALERYDAEESMILSKWRAASEDKQKRDKNGG